MSVTLAIFSASIGTCEIAHDFPTEMNEILEGDLSPIDFHFRDPRTLVEHVVGLEFYDTFFIKDLWQGLHFVLTGRTEEIGFPTNFLIETAPQVLTVFDGHEVARIASFLSTKTDTDLQNAYLPSLMDTLDVFPSGWEVDASDRFESLRITLAELRDFASTREVGSGWICTFL